MAAEMPLTEVRSRFTEVVGRARYSRESTVITQNGTPAARIVPADALAVSADGETLDRLDEERDRIEEMTGDRETREWMAEAVLRDSLRGASFGRNKFDPAECLSAHAAALREADHPDADTWAHILDWAARRVVGGHRSIHADEAFTEQFGTETRDRTHAEMKRLREQNR